MNTYSGKSSCLVFHKRKAPLIRLFCFPYAGGGASVFRQWPDFLPEEVELCAIQPPGRENRISEEPIADVHLLVADLLTVMQHHLEIPFALFGYSTGALVAFEFARELRKKELPLPFHLFVAAARAPHIPEPSPLHHLPEDEFIESLKRFSGTPQAVLENRELMNLYSPILRADLAIEETYRHVEGAPLDVPISAFYGSDDKEGRQEVVAPWEQYTSQQFVLHEIAGNHFFIKTSLRSLLSVVSDRLIENRG